MKLRTLHVTALLGTLAIAACATPPAPTTGTAADEAAIRAIGTTYADAWNKGDTGTLVALAAEDYEAVSADGKVTKGRAGVETEAKAAAAARAGLPLKLSVETSLFRWTSATTAAVGGTWTMAGVPPGMGADKGAWSSTVGKGADGQWRMLTGLVSEYVPPPAPPAAVPANKGK